MRNLSALPAGPLAAAVAVMFQLPSPAAVSIVIWIAGLIVSATVFWMAQKFATRSLEVSMVEIKVTVKELGNTIIALDKTLGERIGKLEQDVAVLRALADRRERG